MKFTKEGMMNFITQGVQGRPVTKVSSGKKTKWSKRLKKQLKNTSRSPKVVDYWLGSLSRILFFVVFGMMNN